MTQLEMPRVLEPLRYHRDLVDYLKTHESAVWQWAHSQEARHQQATETGDLLLRNTYRLEKTGHPAVFEAVAAAAQILEIDAPITLYQARDGAMNASLWYMPGEVHMVFYGSILERLSDEELRATMGHELAHYKLWTQDDGIFRDARSVLDHALSYPHAQPSHRETARLLSLYTELYADRGAALVVGQVEPAISVLVKIMTGLKTIDPQAYLRQAEELEQNPSKSEGDTHPEDFLRARALDLWWKHDPQLEPWLEQRLHGSFSINALDLTRQRELTEMTRGFFVTFLKSIETDITPILTQVKRFFPHFDLEGAPLDLARIADDKIDESTRAYFIALMFDCAMADPELRDQAMAAAAKMAQQIGALEQFKLALRRDLNWTRTQIDRLTGAARKADRNA